MIKISVITNNSCPNSRAFNFPLIASKHFLKEKGTEIRFFWKISENAFNCDILFVNSNVFRTFWSHKKSDIFNFLNGAKLRKLKIYWFDTTDSTWCTQFEVMPFVDKFLKGQIFTDKKMYLQRFQTGRIYTDFFEKLYDSGEKYDSYPLPSLEELDKIEISWNTCFENYTEERFSFSGKLRNFLRPCIANFTVENIKVKWVDPANNRSVPISCRIGTSHTRPSVADHRRAIMDKLKTHNVESGKISLEEYFKELRNSQIAVSPFGVGEITLRDFEIIICGAALLKPDMTHLKTWPDLFQTNLTNPTCQTFNWDLSDFDDKLESLLKNPEKRLEMARNSQNVYKKHLSEEGMQEFTERLIKIFDLT